MNKEKTKTLLLLSLIISSIILTFYIWANEELWSDDYNFFVKWKNFSISQWVPSWFPQQPRNSLQVDYHFYFPQKIIVNYGDSRTIYVKGETEYEKFSKEVSRALEALIRGEQEVRYQSLPLEEWQNVLKKKSFYFDYDVAYATKILGELYGVRDTHLSGYIKNIGEVVLVPEDGVSNDIVFYIKNDDEGIVGKYSLRYDRENLVQLIDRFRPADNRRYRFSFEIPLDKPNKYTRVTVDSNVLIPMQSQKMYVVRSINPIQSEYDIRNILESFGYSHNTLRKYTSMDNTIEYAENDSNLKIHPDGWIEYDAVKEGKGLRLVPGHSSGSGGTVSLRDSMEAAVEFIHGIIGSEQDFYISSVNADPNKLGSYRFNFNYLSGGYPVEVYRGQQGSDESPVDAIQVDMVNGILKRYRHYLRIYDTVDSVDIDVSMTYIFDSIYNHTAERQQDNTKSINTIKVMDLYLNYVDDGNKGLLYPKWAYKVEDSEKVYHLPVIEN
ncbi:MAG: hypothetical protein GX066_05080 [Clostridiaceae bacterium]|nr:hypothetical protein [Clostridiaceae bacterium]